MAVSTHRSRATTHAAHLLGLQVQEGRRRRRWTQSELAERMGVSKATLAKVERGDPSVALGTAFEAAILVGVPLFAGDADSKRSEERRLEDRLALLPERVRRVPVDDDF